MSQHREFVVQARDEFRKELTIIMSDVTPRRKWISLSDLANKLSTDELIAYAYGSTNQLHRVLVQQKATESQHTELALERQKLEEKGAFDSSE